MIHQRSHDTSDSAKRARDAANQEGAAPHDVRLEAAVEGVAGQPLGVQPSQSPAAGWNTAASPCIWFRCRSHTLSVVIAINHQSPIDSRLDIAGNRLCRARTRAPFSQVPNAVSPSALPETDDSPSDQAAFPRTITTDKRR